jgi:hypothetical protein
MPLGAYETLTGPFGIGVRCAVVRYVDGLLLGPSLPDRGYTSVTAWHAKLRRVVLWPAS